MTANRSPLPLGCKCPPESRVSAVSPICDGYVRGSTGKCISIYRGITCYHDESCHYIPPSREAILELAAMARGLRGPGMDAVAMACGKEIDGWLARHAVWSLEARR